MTISIVKQPLKVKITPKKTIEAPPITLIHGEPGIGKSTFAAAAPGVVFICCEQGTNNIPVQRIRLEDESGERDPKTFDEVMFVLDSLIAGVKSGNKDVKNIAIDTVDALEKIIHDHICQRSNKRSVADFNYGKGFDLTVDAMRMVLARLSTLRDLGCGIILISHTKIETFNNPDGQNFDYSEIKSHKKIAGLLVEWSDNVLFARREQYALEEGGKVRGVGTGARFIHTQKTPTYVAKNRYDLPEKMALFWPDFEHAIKNHKPADPEELMKHAKELISQLDDETQKTAKEALSKINIADSRTFTQFVDYCRSKVNLTVKPIETQKEDTK